MTASDVIVTVLTGGRPDLLDRTLHSLAAHARWLVDDAEVVALHNGGDEPTAIVLAGYPFDATLTTRRIGTIGQSMTTLADVAAQSRRRFWLHLEDDWECLPTDGGWLDEACSALASGASQVRLRRADEPVLVRHMVTGRPLVWRDHGTYRLCDDGHYTCNPSLVYAEHAHDAWPAAGERQAQRRWRRHGHRRVAQHLPGVWAHIGEGRSLRAITGCLP